MIVYENRINNFHLDSFGVYITVQLILTLHIVMYDIIIVSI